MPFTAEPQQIHQQSGHETVRNGASQCDDRRVAMAHDETAQVQSTARLCDTVRGYARICDSDAGVAQLVERQPSKLNVDGSSPFARFLSRVEPAGPGSTLDLEACVCLRRSGGSTQGFALQRPSRHRRQADDAVESGNGEKTPPSISKRACVSADAVESGNGEKAPPSISKRACVSAEAADSRVVSH